MANMFPLFPRHTLNIGGEYAITCSPRSIFDRVVFQANYNAAGRIYWTDKTTSANPSTAHSTGERIWKSVMQ